MNPETSLCKMDVILFSFLPTNDPILQRMLHDVNQVLQI